MWVGGTYNDDSASVGAQMLAQERAQKTKREKDRITNAEWERQKRRESKQLADQGYITVQPTSSDYRNGRYSECASCGATITDTNHRQHVNFHKTFTNRRDGNMSRVLWCDQGEHAFKADSPGSLHFEGTGYDETGKQVQQDMDACAEHNPFRASPSVIAKELEAAYPIPKDDTPPTYEAGEAYPRTRG